jgi:hypothetical protein
MTLKIPMAVVDAIVAVVVVDEVAVSQVQMAPTLTLQMKAQIVQRIPAKIPQKVQLIAVAVAAVQLAKV